jgi:hypothetical protein
MLVSRTFMLPSIKSRVTTSVDLVKTALNHEHVLRTRYYTRKIVSAVVTIAIIYSAYLFVPVLTKKYRFEEAVQKTTLISAYNDHEPYQIEDEIRQQAHEIGIPLKEENLHVTREETFVRIEASYALPVSLWPGKNIQVSFAPSSQEKTLTHAAIQVKKLQDGNK